MPGSFKETVLAVSTIISLAAAVIVCNSLLHQGVKETDWLWVSSEIRSSPSESIEGNTAGGWQDGWWSSHQRVQGASANFMDVSSSCHANPSATSPKSSVHSKVICEFSWDVTDAFWSSSLNGHRSPDSQEDELHKQKESERTLLCTTRFLLNFPIIRFVQRTASENICILLCPCNPRTTGVQTGGHVDLLIFLVSA